MFILTNVITPKEFEKQLCVAGKHLSLEGSSYLPLGFASQMVTDESQTGTVQPKGPVAQHGLDAA